MIRSQQFRKSMRLGFLLSVLFFSLSLTAFAQKRTHRKAAKPVVFQGICGTLLVKQGNQMPSPDAPKTKIGGSPAERDVLIYPVLNMSEIQAGENGFINSVGNKKPVLSVKSGKDGKFCARLPVGQYSVIVREPKGLYANLFDSKNNIFPVNVQKNRRSTVSVEITHEAVF